ncbi:D-alanyl-D-alanine carboxypeptidase family protein [Camelimonas sp. ID_303_24]
MISGLKRRDGRRATFSVGAKAAARALVGVVALLPATLALPVAPAAAQHGREAAAKTPAGFETEAAQAILIDDATGSVLFDKAVDAPFAPASMVKIMTAALVFEALSAGKVTPDTMFRVSEHAWRTGGGPSGGSAMFAILNSEVRVGDLLRGMLVQAGNDAAIVLAEGIAGSEPAFVARMTAKAKELGLIRTSFTNASGLPDPGQMTTARDMARLSRHVIATWPELYRVFSEPEFTWNKIRQRNRNPLVQAVNGADGLQTGYTKDGGFALAGSVVQNGQRLVFVLTGLKTAAARSDEARKLVEWAYRTFEARKLFEAGATVGEASVFGGASGSVALAARAPVSVLVRREGEDKLTAQIVYTGPVQAPVAAGAEIGRLVVLRGDAPALETPLYAATAVTRGSLPQRAMDGAVELAGGWIRKALRRE